MDQPPDDDGPDVPLTDHALAESLLSQAILARLREVEGWLAMMIARHGEPMPDGAPGFAYILCAEHAQRYRSVISGTELTVDISYDQARDMFCLVAL